MTNNKKKTLSEKIQEANQTIVISRKGNQEFIWFWSEQITVVKKLIQLMKERYDIAGDGLIITLACKYLLNEIESEIGTEESDGSK